LRAFESSKGGEKGFDNMNDDFFSNDDFDFHWTPPKKAKKKRIVCFEVEDSKKCKPSKAFYTCNMTELIIIKGCVPRLGYKDTQGAFEIF